MWAFVGMGDVRQAIDHTWAIHNGRPVLVLSVDTDDRTVCISGVQEDGSLEDSYWIQWNPDEWDIHMPVNGNRNVFGNHGYMRLDITPQRQWRKAMREAQYISLEWADHRARLSPMAARAILTQQEFPTYSSVLERMQAAEISSAALSTTVGIHTVKDSTLLSYEGYYCGIVENGVVLLEHSLMLAEELDDLGITYAIEGAA